MPAGNLREVFNRHRRLLEQHAPAWGKSPTELFDTLANADPSDEPVYGHNKKIYTDWLVRQLADGLEEQTLTDITRALRIYVTTQGAQPVAGLNYRNLLAQHITPARLNFDPFALKPGFGEGVVLHEWKNIPGFPDYKNQFPGFVLDTLLKHDPQKGRNVPHMLRWLQVKSPARLLPEDLPKVEDDLKLLMKHRAAINPASKRDPANCETAQDLAALVARFRPDFSKLPRGEMEDYALEGGYAKQIADTPLYRLIHITTQRGAQLLGKGTRWCTSWGDGDGRKCWFSHYSQGLFYIRTKKNNAIYQMHFGEWMHNDAEDQPIGNFGGFLKARVGLRDVLLDQCPEIFAAALIHAADYRPNHLEKLLDFCHDGLPRRPGLQTVAHEALKTVMGHYAKGARLGMMGDFVEFCAQRPNYTPAALAAADTTFDILLDKSLASRANGIWQEIWNFKMLCGKHHFLAPVQKWYDKFDQQQRAVEAEDAARAAQHRAKLPPTARP